MPELILASWVVYERQLFGVCMNFYNEKIFEPKLYFFIENH